MRPFQRPFAAAAAAAVLVLTLAACGDDGDGSASDPTGETTSDATAGAASEGPGGARDAVTEAFCDRLLAVAASSTPFQGRSPDAEQWEAVQAAFAALGEAELPPGIPARERDGLRIVLEAIAGLDHAEAVAALGPDGAGEIPGMSEQDNAKADAFFEWVDRPCPELAEGSPGDEDPADGESVTANTE